jgi:Leucine-rich repeat (LRR) protein
MPMTAPAPTAVPTSPVSKPRRRWWQFSLRTLLVGMVGLSMVLALFAFQLQRARRQAAAAENIRKLGFVVEYTYRYEPGKPQLVENPVAESPISWPLVALLGTDFFHDVVDCHPPLQEQPPTSIEDVRRFWQAIEKLPKLRRIQLPNNRGNWIDGRTTTEALRNHHQLQSLLLRNGNLSGEDLQPLAGLERLEGLDVSRNRIDDAGGKYLAAMRKLKQLDLAYNQIGEEGARELAKSRSITWLNLNNNRLTVASVTHLAQMTQLEHLEVDARVNNDVLIALSKLSNLEYLGVGSGGSDRGLREICRLDKLRSLSIGGEGFTDAGVAHLVKLTELTDLSIGGKGITDEGLAAIGKLHKLERLGLSGSFTDEGLAKLASLTELRSLGIQRAPIDGTAFAKLTGLTRLEQLSLSECRVNEAGLTCILQMPRLRNLMVSSSTITGHDLGGVKWPPGAGFHQIILDSSELDDEGLMALGKITCSHLVISGSKVTAEGVKRFRKANPAVTVIGP